MKKIRSLLFPFLTAAVFGLTACGSFGDSAQSSAAESSASKATTAQETETGVLDDVIDDAKDAMDLDRQDSKETSD